MIQFTPPGSGCSVLFGKNLTSAAPGSAQGLYLIVSDIVAARDELLVAASRSASSSTAAACTLARTTLSVWAARVSGLDPERRSYRSFASFSDPDGNGWLLQEITTRLPGALDLARLRPAPQATWRARFGVRRPPRSTMASRSSGIGATEPETPDWPANGAPT